MYNSHIGESVILFDSQKNIPPHPSLINQQQRPKKTWLDTVAGAFTREPLTLPELDLLSKYQMNFFFKIVILTSICF